MMPIIVPAAHLSAFKQNVYDKLTREEQDALFLYLTSVKVAHTWGISVDPSYLTDEAYSPEAFRPVVMAAAADGSSIVDRTTARNALSVMGTVWPSKAKMEAVNQTFMQLIWLRMTA